MIYKLSDVSFYTLNRYRWLTLISIFLVLTINTSMYVYPQEPVQIKEEVEIELKDSKKLEMVNLPAEEGYFMDGKIVPNSGCQSIYVNRPCKILVSGGLSSNHEKASDLSVIVLVGDKYLHMDGQNRGNIEIMGECYVPVQVQVFTNLKCCGIVFTEVTGEIGKNYAEYHFKGYQRFLRNVSVTFQVDVYMQAVPLEDVETLSCALSSSEEVIESAGEMKRVLILGMLYNRKGRKYDYCLPVDMRYRLKDTIEGVYLRGVDSDNITREGIEVESEYKYMDGYSKVWLVWDGRDIGVDSLEVEIEGSGFGVSGNTKVMLRYKGDICVFVELEQDTLWVGQKVRLLFNKPGPYDVFLLGPEGQIGYLEAGEQKGTVLYNVTEPVYYVAPDDIREDIITVQFWARLHRGRRK